MVKAIYNRSHQAVLPKGWVVNGISTVKIDGQDYTVGDIIQNREGKQGRINPDGTITIIN